MSACPSCAAVCPDDARFCPSCGASLLSLASHAVERKVVTTIFCDLVDFTGLCERLDAEDADRLLRTFYALARETIELWGGVVEKYVGDAVVGVFGVPAAHEDDAERAVRTAVRLRDSVADLPQVESRTHQVRIGVTSGAAVVRLDVRPGSGEGFLVGDAVNMAARLQQLAPPAGIVVGDTTRELTSQAFDYARLDPAALKGKRAAVKCWLVQGPVSRMGVDPRQRFAARLVDREVELGILRGLLAKVQASGQPQSALLVGEAGIGKSRLAFELLRYIDSRPAIVRWRHGRCPAYGDGLSFWALGEIVREQLGVLERDGLAVVEAKLAHALADVEEAEWLASRLRPLLGLEAPTASREENFAAWLRFLELIAADAPAVLVFEDLHWASEGTLAFLRYLAEHVSDAPLLLIGTTRLELFEAHPEIVARLARRSSSQRGTRLELRPLSDPESAELVSRMSEGLGGLPNTRQVIVQRAAGNPLFVEQLVRHLEEEWSEASTVAEPGTDATLKERVSQAMPESLQSLIAARLDELPAPRKTLLGDAAVVGEVFWTGAVAALDHGDRAAAEDGLADLAQRALVRRERDSSLYGECEFAFSHGLIRDVAYQQLSRSDRAAKHTAVAFWLEATAGERVDEVAEILAHHYATALGLAREAHEEPLAEELLEPTVRALKLAGDQAMALDVRAAEAHYRHARQLCPKNSRFEASLLVAHGECLLERGDLSQARTVLEKGLRALRKAGDVKAEAVATDRLASTLWFLGEASATKVAARAVDLLADDPPCVEQVKVMADWAAMCSASYDSETAIDVADRALALCRELQLPVSVRALGWRGLARCHFGDAGGLDDLRQALDLARRQGLSRYGAMMRSDLADELLSFRGPKAALLLRREGLELAGQRGDQMSLLGFQASQVADLCWGGKWDAALALAEEIDEPLAAAGQILDLATVRAATARILTARGQASGQDVQAFVTWASGREFPDVSNQVEVLDALAGVHVALGKHDKALGLLGRIAEIRESIPSCPQFGVTLPFEVRAAAELGDLGLARRLAAKTVTSRALDGHVCVLLGALAAENDGLHKRAAAQYADAASRWGAFGVPYEEAKALLGQGRCLLALGRAEAASTPLQGARRVFKRLRADPALSQTMRLLEPPPRGGKRTRGARD